MAIDGEDCDRSRHGVYAWRASTRNHWVLEVVGIHVASVVRNPSWKRLNHQRPWVIEIFGSRFIGIGGLVDNSFRTLDEARILAEKILRGTVTRLTIALGAK